MDGNKETPETNGVPDQETSGRISPKSPRESLAPEPAPPPPRSRHVRNPIVVALNGIMMILVLLALGGGGLVYWGKLKFSERGPLPQETTVIIRANSGLDEITSVLMSEGVITEPQIFSWGVRAYRMQSKLRAGEYSVPAGASMQQVMNLLVSGKAILHPFTVPEGLTSEQIVERLREEELLTGDVAEIPPEGSLLPETYLFTRGAARQSILDRMRREHDKVLADVWKSRREGLPIKTPEELVTLASIVEKETGKADERPRVAAVFINRLNKGMKLQSDPTIIYGLVGGKGALGRPLRRSEIDGETPYNTYVINGLPPGPIANPGRAAMEAVAGPSNTNELYFVAEGTGGHVFSATLAEHNRNVAKYRAFLKANAAAAADTSLAAEETTGNADAASDELDLLDGMPPRDPSKPVLPVPKP
ncbi:putative aminodeoxychorismate lyase [Hartmannibacter diazotrophicus]|uniref:Endolytic murein transglycosylase n=1 Tax=Hartmannibacter diazotrophicus TaxID=1482074 RepID=A0A2C9D4U7_9HYPH|nr:endolytic transglycosylase MltG [Hartmannibacter diazotrophicus]SON55362.1 putative aminodeoxychorismate lyase [Hartmannibacter diazotrophicus]